MESEELWSFIVRAYSALSNFLSRMRLEAVTASCALQVLPSSSYSRLLKLRHQRQEPWIPPITPYSSNNRRKRRTRLACALQPNPQQQPDEDDTTIHLRPEIAPSVLQSLQPENPSPSPNPSSNAGESLIEKNLRKRAMKRRASSSLSTEQDSSYPPAAAPSPDRVSSDGGGKIPLNNGRYAISETCPITTVFWEEIPPDISLENFHNLDFLAKFYRLAFLVHLTLDTDLAVSTDLSFSSFSWFFISSDMYQSMLWAWNSVFEKDNQPKEFLLEWRRTVAKDLGKFTNDQSVIAEVAKIFLSFWDPQYWADRVASGKVMSLVQVLALSAEVDILSGAADDTTGMKKRLEESSAALKTSLLQLHGGIIDPTDIWEKALKGTSFVSDGGRVFMYDHALIFPCKLSSGHKAGLGSILEKVQQCLESDERYSDLVAILCRSSQQQEQLYLVIAPWYWVLPMDFIQFPPLSGFLLMVSCVATAQFAAAGVQYGFLWEPYEVPLGWSAILASVYLTSNMKLPLVFPFPNLGVIGKSPLTFGNMPSRKSLLNVLLKAACAPLAVSLLLLAFGLTFWAPLQFNSGSVIDFRGYVLVPPDLFSYSGILTKLLHSVSVATVEGEDESLKLVASPFVLAGLLGLNFAAFSLFPGWQSDGTYLLRSLLGNTKLVNNISFAFTAMLTVSLFTHNPFLGLTWLIFSFLSVSEILVKDDVSEPDHFTRLAGFMLLVGAVACFIPFPQ